MTEYGELSGKVVAVDFDGVLHSYTSGWTGYVPVDPPEPGALRFVHWLIGQGAEVVIVSSRANRPEGTEAIRTWLRTHGFPELEVTQTKVRAVAYVDDRAVPYAQGDWDDCQARVSLLSGSNRNERRGPHVKTLFPSADAAEDINELTSRLVRDGYVYLPGFLPADTVEAVTGQLRQALHKIGWLAGPDTSKVAPGAEPKFTGDSFRQVYPVIQQLEEFHQLAHDDRILRLMAGLLGGDIFCHPAKVCRISTPSAGAGAYFTRAHQDFVVLHTCSDVLTAWIPFTPCTPESQGLRILADSHRDGFLPTDASVGGARPLYLPVAADDPRWMTADYAVGDLVVFHSLTVHGAGPNASDTVRLSADVRYQRTGDEPMRAEFAHPHGWPRTPDWDELCAGWSTRAWVDTPDTVPLEPMPTDVSYGEYLSTLVTPPSRLLGL